MVPIRVNSELFLSDVLICVNLCQQSSVIQESNPRYENLFTHLESRAAEKTMQANEWSDGEEAKITKSLVKTCPKH